MASLSGLVTLALAMLVEASLSFLGLDAQSRTQVYGTITAYF
jgi:hypothetical protein